MLLPVGGYAGIDSAGVFIEYPFGITVFIRRREYGFPDIKLVAAAAAGAQRQFAVVIVFYEGTDMAQVITVRRPRRLFKIAFHIISVFIVVEIDGHIMVKIDGVGTGRITAIVLVGVKHLCRQHFPAAC